MSERRRRASAVLGLVLLLLLTSCTTVPSTSAPRVVKSFGVAGENPPQSESPPPGAPPRLIVQDFLAASGNGDAAHSAAREFMTAEERGKWIDAQVIVNDHWTVGNPAGTTVIAQGNQIGSIDPTGVYTASLNGNGAGSGGVPGQVTFGMTRVKGEWRIASMKPNVLLIDASQFEGFQQRRLFFFDVSEDHLVPDPRYTQLTDPRDLAAWLIAQLAQGAHGGSLSTALPEQTDPRRVRVLVPTDLVSGGPTKVEIPGASELDTGNADRLGAQIAATLGQVVQINTIQITDGGVPVRIPAAGGITFTADALSTQFAVPAPTSALYYLFLGAIWTASGRRIPGKVGAGVYGLTSAALTPKIGSGTLQIAGVRGASKDEFLDIGTAERLTATTVHGALSRPAWAPDQNEVWIGNGSKLVRVGLSGQAHAVPFYDASNQQLVGQVTAVRLSPEGARIALVLTTGGTSQVYVGAVVRNSSAVRVAGLIPISPASVVVHDVAWNDDLKLFAVGTEGHNPKDFGVWEVQCDGSVWTLRGTTGLPQAPDSVTVTDQQVAVVSTGGTVWRQQADGWEALQGDETHGTNPIYVE